MINNETLKFIWGKGITYEDYLYLYDMYGEGILTVPSTLVSITRLREQGYMTDYAVTPKGIAFLDEVSGRGLSDERFLEFWNLYPAKDPETGRELRHSYMESMNLYAEAAKEFGHENLLNALRKEIDFRENSSSKFKFMKGILKYLQSKEYKNARDSISTKRLYGKAVY